MEKINVEIPQPSRIRYKIIIGENLLSKLPEFIPEIKNGVRVAIITDSIVEKLYGENLLETIIKLNPRNMIFSFPAGEKSKNRQIKEYLEDEMLIGGYARDSIILALGGGVVGDIAGFIASTYYRGIPLYQIPTTIIAMTDSAIGGKTGIDTVYGKNLIGTFYQPSGVIADIGTLSTLPDIEYFSGLAEVLKYGLIMDEEFFHWVEENRTKITEKKKDILEEMVTRSCKNKIKVVVQDEKESGLRKILNFGHTIGHAIEVTNDYKVKHGVAVAYGMIIETIISRTLGLIPPDEVEHIAKTIYQIVIEKIGEKIEIVPEKIINAVKYDKKVRKGKPEYVLPKSTGKVIDDITIPVEDETVLKSIEEFLSKWDEKRRNF